MLTTHLKRLSAAAAGALCLVATSGTPIASAAPPADGSLKPACVDITDGLAALTTATNGTGTLTFAMGLAAPACRQVTYALTVAPLGASTRTTTSYTVGSDGYLYFTVTGLPVGTDGTPVDVCVSGETLRGGRSTALDRAPDAGCLTVTATGIGATRFN